MKNASRKKNQDNHFYQLTLRIREGVMILAGSFAIFLLLSFLTYHHGDPGWSTTGDNIHVANAGGYVGAWLSDFFLYLFGYFAYIFPFLIAYFGWQTVKAGYISYSLDWRKLLPIRLSGLFVLILAGSGFCNLQFNFLRYHLPYEAGGILGSAIANLLGARFNLPGATILLLAFICLGSMFLTGMSWLKLSEKAGQLTLSLFQRWQEYRRNIKKQKLTTIQQKLHLQKSKTLSVEGNKGNNQNLEEHDYQKPTTVKLAKREAILLAEEPEFEISFDGHESPERSFLASAKINETTSTFYQTMHDNPLTKTVADESAFTTIVKLAKNKLTRVLPTKTKKAALSKATQQPMIIESFSSSVSSENKNSRILPNKNQTADFQINKIDNDVEFKQQTKEQYYPYDSSRSLDSSNLQESDINKTLMASISPSHSTNNNKITKNDNSLLHVTSEEKFKNEALSSLNKVHAPKKNEDESVAVKKQIPMKQSSFLDGELPSIALLDAPAPVRVQHVSHDKLERMSRDVEARLKEFGVEVRVVAVHPGPVITRFEMQLAPGVKVSRISSLAKDLARALSVMSVRIVEVIAGKSVVGLEVPNEYREVVRLSEILASSQYEQIRSPLSLSLGKDIAGHPAVVDLAKMPHLLVAGTTGSGKSVGVNAMLLGMLYKATPKDLRLILVDPKMLELSIYEGIPHLLTPVVTDMKEAANALRWCVAEMERRYRLMAGVGVRNLAGFNQKIIDANDKGDPLQDPTWKGPPGEEPRLLVESLPYIVVVIDEFADMMMVVGKKVEQLIARIAQKARAAGIHLILATQRPSVDVITGLIKANIPTRIAFQVSSKIDSRTVLDQGGAEQLLGQGDMLYLPPGNSVPVRVHGAFVADDEVHRVVEDWKKRGTPEYIEEITCEVSETGEKGNSDESDGENDPLYSQAVHIVTLTRRASISNLQRRLKIGYNRAARLIEEMENAGVVTPMESNGSREVIAPPPPE